jgi:glycosyltransferase involved in cell wall biosynthesis
VSVSWPSDRLPLVSVVLPTRDRPDFLQIALACYAQQTYPRRELIVVDDGIAYPVNPAAVAEVGGRLVQVEPDTPLGTKLNRGVAEARGRLCQKMDDDDWYAPAFVETMVGAVLDSWRVACRPTVAFLMGFLFFDVARWEVRRSIEENAPGATLLFTREDWEEHPFRAVPRDEDVWFYLDQVRAGGSYVTVNAPETFLAVRHGGGLRDRGHTWTRQLDGQPLEAYLLDRPLYPGGPEALLPAWALARYSDLQQELLAGASAPQGLSQNPTASPPPPSPASGAPPWGPSAAPPPHGRGGVL